MFCFLQSAVLNNVLKKFKQVQLFVFFLECLYKLKGHKCIFV